MKVCTVDDCSRPHRARGLCGSHYNQRHQPNRHQRETVACAHCGTNVVKRTDSRRPVRFCSNICRELWRIDTGTNPQPTLEWREMRCTVPQSHPARWIGDTTPVTYAKCRRCSATLVRSPGGRRTFCSSDCRRRWTNHNPARQARRAGRRKIRRAEIFKRDGYTCWVCDLPCNPEAEVPDPQAPTVDHLTPRAFGGTDDPENLATAHFQCNSERGASWTWPVRHAA